MTDDEMTALEELRAALADDADARGERAAAREVYRAVCDRADAAYNRTWEAREALFASVRRSVEGEPVTA